MHDISRSPFPPLLRRLKDHVENGVPVSEEDYADAMQPGCLVFAAMVAGDLARFRDKHIRGNHAYPLTHDAAAYRRAHDLALRICAGLEAKIKLISTVILHG